MQFECSNLEVNINLLSPRPSYKASCPTAESYLTGSAAHQNGRQKALELLVHMLRQSTRVLLDGLESSIRQCFPPNPIPGKILLALHGCSRMGATLKSKEEGSLSYAARLEIIQKCASIFHDRRAASAVKKRATVTISAATTAYAWCNGRNGTSGSAATRGTQSTSNLNPPPTSYLSLAACLDAAVEFHQCYRKGLVRKVFWMLWPV
jgi:hypothetical protein